MGLYKQATTRDIGRYNYMFSKAVMRTQIMSSPILYGILPSAYNGDIKRFIRDSAMVVLYESKQTLIATYGKQASGMNITPFYNPGKDKMFVCEVNIERVLDTLDTYGLSILEKCYRNTVIKEKIDQLVKSKDISIDDAVIEYLKNSSKITGIRGLYTEGNPIYNKSKFRQTAYVCYNIYDASTIKNCKVIG